MTSENGSLIGRNLYKLSPRVAYEFYNLTHSSGAEKVARTGLALTTLLAACAPRDTLTAIVQDCGTESNIDFLKSDQSTIRLNDKKNPSDYGVFASTIKSRTCIQITGTNPRGEGEYLISTEEASERVGFVMVANLEPQKITRVSQIVNAEDRLVAVFKLIKESNLDLYRIELAESQDANLVADRTGNAKYQKFDFERGIWVDYQPEDDKSSDKKVSLAWILRGGINYSDIGGIEVFKYVLGGKELGDKALKDEARKLLGNQVTNGGPIEAVLNVVSKPAEASGGNGTGDNGEEKPTITPTIASTVVAVLPSLTSTPPVIATVTFTPHPTVPISTPELVATVSPIPSQQPIVRETIQPRWYLDIDLGAGSKLRNPGQRWATYISPYYRLQDGTYIEGDRARALHIADLRAFVGKYAIGRSLTIALEDQPTGTGIRYYNGQLEYLPVIDSNGNYLLRIAPTSSFNPNSTITVEHVLYIIYNLAMKNFACDNKDGFMKVRSPDENAPGCNSEDIKQLGNSSPIRIAIRPGRF